MDINIPFTDNLMADVISVIDAANAGNLTTIDDAVLKVVPDIEVHTTQVAVLAHALSLTAQRAQVAEESFTAEQATKNAALQDKSRLIERMVSTVQEMGSENDFCTRGMAGFVAQVLDISEEQAVGYFMKDYVATFTVTVCFSSPPGDEDDADLDLDTCDVIAPSSGEIESISWTLNSVGVY
jgi:hypothetical protein